MVSKKNNYRVFFHILLWIGMWWLFFALMRSFDDIVVSGRRATLYVLGLISIVYFNLEVLLPRFHFRGRNGLYWGLGIASVVLILFVHFQLHKGWIGSFMISSENSTLSDEFPILDNPFFIPNLARFMVYSLAFAASSVYGITHFARKKEREDYLLRNEKLNAEMKFLKSQMNPHFLFNVLNNIYTMAFLKKEGTPELILKLSGMLRYMLYDCQADLVPLKKEIEYMRHFIDFKLLKSSKGMNVEVELAEANEDQMIAPLLFIPFIENAFKHSKIEDEKTGFIRISLKMEDKDLEFTVVNSLPERAYSKDEVGGIGIQNIQKQLQLRYPYQHVLDFGKKNNQFFVSLKIDRSCLLSVA